MANGQEAGLAWECLVRGNLDQVECEKTRKALLDYCGQDTTAMVRLARWSGRMTRDRESASRR